MHPANAFLCCPRCDTNMQKTENYNSSPSIIAFITTDKALVDNNIVYHGINQVYRLCGIVYWNGNHFVSHIIDKTGKVWYYDGASNNGKMLYYGNIVNFNSKKLQTAGIYIMSILLYTKLN